VNAKDRPRFDPDALRRLAGDKAFARGQAYHRDGHVRILALESSRVLARVEGSEDYRVQLTGQGGRIGGTCTCPAFDDYGFCKHLVATALEINAGGGTEPEDGGVLARIRDHLKAKGGDALVEMIIGLAEQDEVLFRKLETAAAMAGADDKSIVASARKAIDKATRTRGMVDYYAAGDWAEEVSTALDPLDDLLTAGRAGLALELAEHAIDRIEAALENIDDSNGECGGVLCRAQEVHLAAARAANPNPVRLAEALFVREMKGQYDTFDGAASAYAEVLGEEGLAEYRRLADEAWATPPPDDGGGDELQLDGAYFRLKSILDFFAERDGDVDARIALRAKDLTSPASYLQLAQFCLEQGRADEALRWAEEGLWVFEDRRPDEWFVRFTAGLLSDAGRSEQAETLLRGAFEKEPGRALYTEIRELGGDAARDWAITVLHARLTGGAPTRSRAPADLLMGILLEEGMVDAAWSVLRRHGGTSIPMRMDLCRVSETTHPNEVSGVYEERVEDLIRGGTNDGYAEAAKLVARMALLRSKTDHTAYVAALKERHARKRNFMKLLG